MNLKNIFTNLCLTLTSIYIPLVITSSYDYFYINEVSKILNKRVREEDIPQKISAIKAGISPSLTPNYFFKNNHNLNIYPIGSIPLQKTFRCNEGYGLITYKTDRFGLRNDDKKWEKVMKERNIFVIGDSFAHGSCVRNSLTIPFLIEKSKNINTINLASAGNDPYDYKAILKSIVSPILINSNNKNTVILIFYANDDIGNNIKKEKMISEISPIVKFSSKTIETSESYKINFTSLIQNNNKNSRRNLILNLKFKSISTYPLIRILTLVDLKNRIKQFVQSSISKNNNLEEPILGNSISEESISLRSDVCNKDCFPIVAYIPNSTFWNPMNSSKKYKLELKRISKKMGITFIDGESVIEKDNMNDYAPKGGHLSENGYKKISNLLINGIKN